MPIGDLEKLDDAQWAFDKASSDGYDDIPWAIFGLAHIYVWQSDLSPKEGRQKLEEFAFGGNQPKANQYFEVDLMTKKNLEKWKETFKQKIQERGIEL